MANPEKIERATFKIQGKSNSGFSVDFNPESLQYTVSNSIKNKGRGNKNKQYTSESTGKLTIDLVFDTTDSGEDVRVKTAKVAKFMEPVGKKTPPVVIFEWGLYTFKGMVESIKETIDYFASNGVPLRASINLSMLAQDTSFEAGDAGTTGSAGLPGRAIPASPGNTSGATDVATRAGAPGAAKEIASSNGIENMRFPGEVSLEIGGSVSLKAPAAFATGGVGISAGIGLDIGLDVGAGLDISGGLDIAGELSAAAGIAGGTADIFSGLRTNTSSTVSATLDLDNFLDAEITGAFGTEDIASFDLGGGAGLQGSASLKAEVGAAGELKASIEFDGPA